MTLIIDLFMNYFILFIMVLVSVSFFTLFERKLMSYLQNRKGPNKVGIIGIFQAFSDGMKLFSKEIILLELHNYIYFISPFIMFLFSFFIWIFFPFIYEKMFFFNSMFLIICLMSLNVYPLMFAGIFSKSMYSILGGLRSIAQTISYEVSFILLIFGYLIMVESLNLNSFFMFNYMFFLILFPMMVMLYVSILAELNRTPFDFSEGESELVSGFNIEYMSGLFALMFLGEYSNIIFLSMIFSIMNFLNYYYFVWMMLLYLIIFIRSLLPRYRYDMLMFLVWLIILPLTLMNLMFLSFLKFYFFNMMM